MRFEVRGNLTPKQSVKVFRTKTGGVQGYPNPDHKKYKENVVGQIVNQLPSGFTPIAGPVRIQYLEFRFVTLNSFSCNMKRYMREYDIGKPTRPDLDNLMKAVLDSFNGIVWKDDSQVVEMVRVRKIFGTPGFTIDIEEIEERAGKYPLLSKFSNRTFGRMNDLLITEDGYPINPAGSEK